MIDIHLRRNPALAEELRNMSVPGAIAKIGRIAEQLGNEKREKVCAPSPINPVGQSSSRTGMSLEEVSVRDYIKIRNKQERDWRRGR
jgi:hypothetical protein